MTITQLDVHGVSQDILCRMTRGERARMRQGQADQSWSPEYAAHIALFVVTARENAEKAEEAELRRQEELLRPRRPGYLRTVD